MNRSPNREIVTVLRFTYAWIQSEIVIVLKLHCNVCIRMLPTYNSLILLQKPFSFYKLWVVTQACQSESCV